MEIADDKLRSAKKLLAEYPVDLAYVFGSATNGGVRRDSDIDIAILLRKGLSKERRFKLRLLLAEKLQKIFKKNVDLVILNDTSSLFFKYVIIKEGVAFYKKNEEQRLDFENRVMSLYFDFQPFFNLYNRHYVQNNAA